MLVHQLLFCSCIVHVEHVAQDLVVIEAEEAEGQEELYPESEAVEPVEEPALEANSANSFTQPGKHRKHFTQSLLYKSTFHAIT